MEKQKSNLRLLQKLDQGSAAPFDILPKGKRGRTVELFNNRANTLAARLVQHIRLAKILRSIHISEAQRFKRELPEWFQDAQGLESFSKATWRIWADVAWRVLKEGIRNNDPHSHNEDPGQDPHFYQVDTKR